MTNEEATSRLFEAAKKGNLADARAALDAGANANASLPGSQETMLHLAVGNRYKAIATLLIDRGAKLEAQNVYGETPLHYAVYTRQIDLVSLLLGKGANTEVQSHAGQNPQQLAAHRNFHAIIGVLDKAAKKQQGHAGRVTEERKDKGPPQVGA